MKKINNFLFLNDFLILEINFFGTFLSTTNKHFSKFIELLNINLDILEITLEPINIGYLPELDLIISLEIFIFI